MTATRLTYRERVARLSEKKLEETRQKVAKGELVYIRLPQLLDIEIWAQEGVVDP